MKTAWFLNHQKQFFSMEINACGCGSIDMVLFSVLYLITKALKPAQTLNWNSRWGWIVMAWRIKCGVSCESAHFTHARTCQSNLSIMGTRNCPHSSLGEIVVVVDSSGWWMFTNKSPWGSLSITWLHCLCYAWSNEALWRGYWVWCGSHRVPPGMPMGTGRTTMQQWWSDCSPSCSPSHPVSVCLVMRLQILRLYSVLISHSGWVSPSLNPESPIGIIQNL